MSIALMLQDEDNQRIEKLKKSLGIRKKVDVVRAALQLLEKDAARKKRIKRWKLAVKMVAKNSEEINKDFQHYSSLKGL